MNTGRIPVFINHQPSTKLMRPRDGKEGLGLVQCSERSQRSEH